MTKQAAAAKSEHQALIDYWCEQWAAKHGGLAYPFNGARDAKQVKELRAMVPDGARLRRYIQVYLGLDDPWFVARGYSLATFKANLPQVIQAAQTNGTRAPKRLHGVKAWADE